MKFNRELVYTSEKYFLVFSVEGEGEDLVLYISCQDAPGHRVGDVVELSEGYELVELKMALGGCETLKDGPLTIHCGQISWLLPSGENESFKLKGSQARELRAVIEYLIPIFALGVEA